MCEAIFSCMLGNFSCFCCCLLTFFKINFQKILSRTLSECQTVWIQIRTDIMSVLIGVKTVTKDYQQTAKVNAGLETVRMHSQLSSRARGQNFGMVLLLRYIDPNLGQNCYQRLSTDGQSRCRQGKS